MNMVAMGTDLNHTTRGTGTLFTLFLWQFVTMVIHFNVDITWRKRCNMVVVYLCRYHKLPVLQVVVIVTK